MTEIQLQPIVSLVVLIQNGKKQIKDNISANLLLHKTLQNYLWGTVYLILLWGKLVLESTKQKLRGSYALDEDLSKYNFRDFGFDDAAKFKSGYNPNTIFNVNVENEFNDAILTFFGVANLREIPSFLISTSTISNKDATNIINTLVSKCASSTTRILRRMLAVNVCQHLNVIFKLVKVAFPLKESRLTIGEQGERVKNVLKSASLYAMPPG